jgi:hypothetical protein
MEYYITGDISLVESLLKKWGSVHSSSALFSQVSKNFFSSSLTTRPNKLEGFCPWKTFPVRS